MIGSVSTLPSGLLAHYGVKMPIISFALIKTSAWREDTVRMKSVARNRAQLLGNGSAREWNFNPGALDHSPIKPPHISHSMGA